MLPNSCLPKIQVNDIIKGKWRNTNMKSVLKHYFRKNHAVTYLHSLWTLSLLIVLTIIIIFYCQFYLVLFTPMRSEIANWLHVLVYSWWALYSKYSIFGHLGNTSSDFLWWWESEDRPSQGHIYQGISAGSENNRGLFLPWPWSLTSSQWLSKKVSVLKMTLLPLNH